MTREFTPNRTPTTDNLMYEEYLKNPNKPNYPDSVTAMCDQNTPGNIVVVNQAGDGKIRDTKIWISTEPSDGFVASSSIDASNVALDGVDDLWAYSFDASDLKDPAWIQYAGRFYPFASNLCEPETPDEPVITTPTTVVVTTTTVQETTTTTAPEETTTTTTFVDIGTPTTIDIGTPETIVSVPSTPVPELARTGIGFDASQVAAGASVLMLCGLVAAYLGRKLQ